MATMRSTTTTTTTTITEKGAWMVAILFRQRCILTAFILGLWIGKIGLFSSLPKVAVACFHIIFPRYRQCERLTHTATTTNQQQQQQHKQFRTNSDQHFNTTGSINNDDGTNVGIISTKDPSLF